MNRTTDAQLYSKCETVNRLLGFEGESMDDFFLVDGCVTLDMAYGGTQVVQYVGPHGGETNLSERGTKAEAKIYLNGLIKGLDLARKR